MTPLHVASGYGHLDLVRYLVSQGAQVERCDNDGDTPLIVASRKGHLDVVRYLKREQAQRKTASPEGMICNLIVSTGGYTMSKGDVFIGSELS